MIRVNIHEAKTHLSRHLAQVERGETVIICRHNVPIAEIRPLAKPAAKARKIGPLRGRFEVPQSFFEPLPDELIRAFEGGSTADS